MDDNNLGHLRKSYEKNNLDIEDLKGDPIKFFKAWFAEAEACSEIEEPNAMSLTTLGLDDYPKARLVLLKAFKSDGLVFFTNYLSEKGISIEHHSKVGLSFFWPPLERQVIIKGEAEKISNIESDKYFDSRPFGSKIGAIVSDQSRVISDRTVMEAKMEALKIEYQNKEIKRPEYWGGYLVRPICIEFWQGRPNRLHDRVRCQLKSGLWILERLAP